MKECDNSTGKIHIISFAQQKKNSVEIILL